jgi:hypothetical protein
VIKLPVLRDLAWDKNVTLNTVCGDKPYGNKITVEDLVLIFLHFDPLIIYVNKYKKFWKELNHLLSLHNYFSCSVFIFSFFSSFMAFLV